MKYINIAVVCMVMMVFRFAQAAESKEYIPHAEQTILGTLYLSEGLSYPSFEIRNPLVRDSVELDSLIDTIMIEKHLPGVATWASLYGEVIWQKCYGYANLEDSIPVADTTIFALRSISKTVTGTAIMQLWERGEFDLDEDINNYLPDTFEVNNPFYPDSIITFRMLMTHTSSITHNIGLSFSIVRTIISLLLLTGVTIYVSINLILCVSFLLIRERFLKDAILTRGAIDMSM